MDINKKSKNNSSMTNNHELGSIGDYLKDKIQPDSDPAGQMAITKYCLEAIQEFQGKSSEFIREVGFEIANRSIKGLDPNYPKKIFILSSLPDKQFTGLQLICYLYVAFQSIDPELNLGLNFSQEYESANILFKTGEHL